MKVDFIERFADIDKIKKMILDGQTAYQIVDTIGCKLSYFRFWLKKNKLKTVWPRPARHLLTVKQEMEVVRIYQNEKISSKMIGKNLVFIWG